MSKMLAFRPKSNQMVDFLLIALAAAIKKNGPIKITQKEIENQWRTAKISWHYLGDGSIRFELEDPTKVTK